METGATREIPEAWVGETVYVGLLVPTGGAGPASGTFKMGTLEKVGVFGITGTFVDAEKAEEGVSSFYPWSAVLSITSVEETNDALGL